MSTPLAPESLPVRRSRWRRHRKVCLWATGTVGASYLLSAYVFMPFLWHRYTSRHPALDQVPRVTRTASGIPGDPLNIALVGNQERVVKLLTAAGWQPADDITLKSCLRLTRSTVFSRPYETAPVSNLYLWGRKQDLAFQHPAGNNPRKRHHVRFWRSEDRDEDGRPLWVGAATFDRSVGLSHTTGQITHHIDGDVDAERAKLLQDLRKTGLVEQVLWVDAFHERLEGRNGGGDPYRTDGRLLVCVLAPADKE